MVLCVGLGDGRPCWKVMGAKTGDMVGAVAYAADPDGRKMQLNFPPVLAPW